MRAQRSAPDDEVLLDGVLDRDTAAFTLLYERHGRAAYGLAVRILGDSGGAEDVVQDAFLALWRRAESDGPTRGTVRTWLLSIVHHRAIDHLRRRVPREERPVALDALLLPPHDLTDTWEQARQSLEGQQVRDALAGLPPDQQHSILLAYYTGLTHDEIAGVLHVPLGTVKGRLRLGLHKMRDHLQASGGR